MAKSKEIYVTKTKDIAETLNSIKKIKPLAIVIEIDTLIESGKTFAESCVENKCDMVVYHRGEFFKVVDGKKDNSKAGYCLKKHVF